MSEREQEEVCTCVLIPTYAQHSPHSLTENSVHKSTEGKIQSQKGEYLEW